MTVIRVMVLHTSPDEGQKGVGRWCTQRLLTPCFVGDSSRSTSVRLVLPGDECRAAMDRRLRRELYSLLRFGRFSLLVGPLQRSSLAPKSARSLLSRSLKRGECDGGPLRNGVLLVLISSTPRRSRTYELWRVAVVCIGGRMDS